MVSRVSHTTVDCHDAFALSQWWKPVLGYVDVPGDANEVGDHECMIVDPRTGHRLLFIAVPDGSLPGKRIHLDLVPIDVGRDVEVARVVALGATLRADRRRQDGSGWVVLADPEGNEFCVLRSDAERGERSERLFVNADLSGSRFVNCYFDQAKLRGADLSGASIDGVIDGLSVNGVDVAPFVEAELNGRFPGRALRRATTCADLRRSWERVADAWSGAVTRFRALPASMLEASVDGEWSFVQTMRHLVMATDVWLGGTIHQLERPYHPLGLPFSEYEADGYDMSPFTETSPSLERVLDVRAQRQAMVTEFLYSISNDDELGAERPHPWASDRSVTVGHCIGVILNEEWEHLRYAMRDAESLTDRESPAGT